MPTVRMNTFSYTIPGAAIGKAVEVFRWDDDPADDSAFIAFVDPTGQRQAQVDRSGPGPVLRWTRPDSTAQQADLTARQYWRPNAGDPWMSEPGAVDITGYWSCDEYGRPYNLADLQAPGTDPRIGQIQAHAAAIARDSGALDQ